MDAEQRRRAEDTLRFVDALVKAMGRREEVFHVVEDSENPDEAIRRLGELLELDEMLCRAILDTQVRRFTREQRRTIAAQAEELRSSLSSGGEPQRVEGALNAPLQILSQPSA
jgi:DNA gyrase/topoisomerase IV subunit A